MEVNAETFIILNRLQIRQPVLLEEARVKDLKWKPPGLLCVFGGFFSHSSIKLMAVLQRWKLV